MNTPIADFCRDYAEKDIARLHMPGHKGTGPLGVEAMDLTEIAGADSLYEADGIIAESERNAASLFGTRGTFYSCGGSSQSVKAMCLLALRNHAKTHFGKATILAGRNAHKSFVQAAQLLQFDVRWLSSEEDVFSLCRCAITPGGLDLKLRQLKDEAVPLAAVYVTSPDYLGNILDIRGLADVAHSYGVPLLVDNAHGAYLKFLPEDRHPITLGADVCTDSAHKTLPVLTGGGYLHIGPQAPEGFEETARDAMCLFGSTSPSYLILQSLDLCNAWLSDEAPSAFAETAGRVTALKETLLDEGLELLGNEPLKVTIDCRSSLQEPGTVFADRLRDFSIECEYADRDTVVLMFSPFSRPDDHQQVELAVHMLMQVERASQNRILSGLRSKAVSLSALLPTVITRPYEVLNRPTEEVPVEEALGRIAADVRVGCPPAVLPVVPGEKIDRGVVEILKYCGIGRIMVLKQI